MINCFPFPDEFIECCWKLLLLQFLVVFWHMSWISDHARNMRPNHKNPKCTVCYRADESPEPVHCILRTLISLFMLNEIQKSPIFKDNGPFWLDFRHNWQILNFAYRSFDPATGSTLYAKRPQMVATPGIAPGESAIFRIFPISWPKMVEKWPKSAIFSLSESWKWHICRHFRRENYDFIAQNDRHSFINHAYGYFTP